MSGEKELEISNKKFFEAWKKIFMDNERKLLDISDYTSLYTDFILKKDDCVINKIAKELGLKTYTEYYHIDAVLYDESDCLQYKPKHNTWGKRMDFCLKRIRVAFEHENNLKTAYQEIIHLLTTNADIKILVTYAEKEDIKKHAEDFCKIIEGIKNIEPKILVIFGCYINEKNKYEWFSFELKENGQNEILN
jgi:hypothetical protein